ncbi:cytochrome c1 [Arenimonas caeni]|jgi:ubiquinol-cytochrome c reductase cytochrome c1 subunit|uniref:Cytochrome c1 n=1 Tax=Arenimonas caeni TaxID=2058085 RepID=A0A2P6M7P5_9GAMM|nr:cytochrome c1 [Arenimonas caeni]MDY0023195.1 cytochrome c1 [Arenimonas caeni]PRH82017.1 cytochrome c1 [Arenimonas caeni]
MTKLRLFALLLALVPALGLAAGPGPALEHSGTDLSDKASLQRGAGLYMNYCASCHALSMHRYSRIASDLDLPPELVEQHLMPSHAKIGENIHTGINAGDGDAWLGKAPPDLSLTSRARLGGPDYIYSYLKGFYIDEARPMGWNNTVFPGASMPNVLWELQGIQRPVYDQGADGQSHLTRLELASPGRLSPQEFDRVARDISAFLQYVAEPAALKRESVGVWVILFLVFFTFIAYLLKLEFWRDVH